MMRTLATLAMLSVSSVAAAQDANNPWERRVPPEMPPTAERSGYCCMTLHSREDGSVEAMDISYCTESVFDPATEAAVSQWRFAPESRDRYSKGGEVMQQIMTYQLADMFDRCIPDPDGRMCNGEGGFVKDMNYDYLCRAEWVS